MMQQELKDYLTDQNLFQEGVDIYLLKDLYNNFKLFKEAKKEVDSMSILVDV